MKLTHIRINNFRSVKEINFTLLENLNVFVGVNGSGKTTILDAISIPLSWLINRIQRENASGKHISDSDVKNDTTNSNITLTVKEGRKDYSWKLTKAAKGTINLEKSELGDLSDLANHFQKILEEKATLPVIAYYPIDRVVSSSSPFITGRENLSILDVYDAAIGGKTNYQSFFEWFRLQDDIINESVSSRNKWMIKNKSWVKKRTDKLVSKLEQAIKDTEDFPEFKYTSRRLYKDEFIYEDPRFLFHELAEVIHMSRLDRNEKYPKLFRAFRDIEYLLHRMGALSDSRKDDLINTKAFPFHIIEGIIFNINENPEWELQKDEQKKIISFIWDALLFSITLSLWWMSDKGKKEVEKLFNDIDPTKFRNKNSEKNPIQISKSLEDIISNDIKRLDRVNKGDAHELHHVTKTIEKFVPGYSNLRVTRVPRPHMLVDKDGETIRLDQLSDGEKNLIALVGDIARRLAIANPNSKDPLKGNGIILIDEIDLHLHPSWQRLIISRLPEVFPNCQFIVTTHSPQVISHVSPDSLFLLETENGIMSYNKAIESYGLNTDRILEDLLEVDARPEKIKKDLQKLFKSIEKDNIEFAKDLLSELKNIIGDDPELVKANVLIKRREILGK